MTVARSVTAEAVTPVLNAEETAYLPQPFASFADTGPEVAEVYELPTFPSPGGDATPLGPSLPQTAAREHEPAAPEHEPALAQRSKTTLPALPIVQRQPAHDSPHSKLTVARPSTSSAEVSFASMFSAAGGVEQESGFTSVDYTTVELTGAATPATSPPAPVLQRQEGASDSAAEAPTPAPTTTVAAAAAAPPGAPATGADVDELARRLFEPLSARLRSELWLDRERAGLMSDARP